MARYIDADSSEELTRKCLVEQIENIIWQFEQQQLSETDIEDVNYEDLKCISEALQFYQLKIINQPAADVKPIVRGDWIQVDQTKQKCSNCETTFAIYAYPNSNNISCPNCGADMRKDDKRWNC